MLFPIPFVYLIKKTFFYLDRKWMENLNSNLDLEAYVCISGGGGGVGVGGGMQSIRLMVPA